MDCRSVDPQMTAGGKSAREMNEIRHERYQRFLAEQEMLARVRGENLELRKARARRVADRKRAAKAAEKKIA